MSVLQIDHDGPVTVVTITRPDCRNAINGETAVALREAFQAFEADDKQRVMIVTGGDSDFCAGADLKDIDSLDLNDECGPLGFTRMHASKPTIAAIAGYAVAGGLELACWCDLRIADETAQFGCLERRFAVPLVDGGTVRLPQIVGLGRALDLILTGRLIDVQEAHTMGLVNTITAQGEHLEHAIATGKQLAAFPQSALLNDRRSVYESFGKSFGDALHNEAKIGFETWASGEGSAGAQAFTEGKGRGAVFED